VLIPKAEDFGILILFPEEKYILLPLKEDSEMGNKAKKSLTNKSKEEKETPKKAEKNVEFAIQAPEAKEVYLAGEFNQWSTQSLPMKRDNKGIWKLKTPLPPGRYEYKFYVDGNWVEGSTGTEQVLNSFGTQNFVLKI
jgi:1,4-alpha-glucan branching enzyme